MEQFKDQARQFGINLSPEMEARFRTYLNELTAWNKTMNLTAIDDERGILERHFLDSLSVVPLIPEDARTLIDIGAGAGFPGLPIKIVRPELRITLLDATEKKIAFLNHVIQSLGLSGAETLHARAEDAGHLSDLRETFDVAVARAVANLPTLSELALPFVKIGGIFIAQKSAETGETERAVHAVRELGGKTIAVKSAGIANLPDRELVIIEKISPTPERFPRRNGVPLKKPL